MSSQQLDQRGLSRARFLGAAAAGAGGLVLARLGGPSAARAATPSSPFDLVPGQLIPASAATTALIGVKVLDGYPSARLAVLDPQGHALAVAGMEHPRSNGPGGFSGRDTQTLELPSGATASRSLEVAVAPGSRTVNGALTIIAGGDRMDVDLAFDVLDRPGGLQPAYRVRGGEVRAGGRAGTIRAVDRPFVVAATAPDDVNDLRDALQAFDQAGRRTAADAVLGSALYRLLAQVHADPLLLVAEAMAINTPAFSSPAPWAFPTGLDCMLGKTVEQTVPSVLLHHLSCMAGTASFGIDQSSVRGFNAAWPQ
jgi:hypothetical protein